MPDMMPIALATPLSDLLIELFSEEIPARMQQAAQDGFAALIKANLEKAKIAFTGIEAYSTPRRLCVHVTGLPKMLAAQIEELKGPATTAVPAALDGFMKKNNILNRDDLVTKNIKGTDYYFFERKIDGGPTIEVLGGVITQAIEGLSWPKSMRWGAQNFRWVRPLHHVLAVFDGGIVPGELDLGNGTVLNFSNHTMGHRFMGQGSMGHGAQFCVHDFAEYQQKLAENYVILDRLERREKIWHGVNTAVKQLGQGFSILEDEKLIDEVVGLVEWPVPFVGSFDAQFLEIPREVITTSMRENQRYFSVINADGKLCNYFVCVANMVPKDDGATIIHGNEKVLRARLSDARFFWNQDLKQPLEHYAKKLSDIRFHEKLGSMQDKTARLIRITENLQIEVAHTCWPRIKSDAGVCKRAAQLCKADLVTGMVKEFPELQGIMGGYYAAKSSQDKEAAEAIRSHYSPLGPNDPCPRTGDAAILALADKLDNLVGFFAIGEKPTGSKDPFALRRSALGVIRLLLENEIEINIDTCLHYAVDAYRSEGKTKLAGIPDGLVDFVKDRYKGLLKSQNYDPTIIDSVVGPAINLNVVGLTRRVKTLSEFMKTDQGQAVLQTLKRVHNILESEGKKSTLSNTTLDQKLLQLPAEHNLYQQLQDFIPKWHNLLGAQNDADSLLLLNNLQPYINEFFDHVLVNDPDPAIKASRLALLSQIRDETARLLPMVG